jgi:hypothetical protein
VGALNRGFVSEEGPAALLSGASPVTFWPANVMATGVEKNRAGFAAASGFASA